MEVYYVKPVENCRLVPVADPRPHRQYLSMTFLAALFFAVAMHSAWQRFAGVQDGYRLEMLQQEKERFRKPLHPERAGHWPSIVSSAAGRGPEEVLSPKS